MANAHFPSVYRPGFGLATDLYQLTMAAGYYHRKVHERRAIFHLFFRSAPFGESAALACGLPLAADVINGLRFSADDVQYLGRLKNANGAPMFREPFLNYLQRLRFTGDVHAIPEGMMASPQEPLLRVEARLVEAQLLETALLTVMNFSTLIATKAARIKAAAGEDTVLEFGLRRAQGLDGGLTASRAAYIGGCDATSNVWAGRYYGIPVKGTHAHAWVMAFPNEMEAFEAYAAAMPGNCVFLVDTYDTIEGVKKAIRVGLRLRENGHEMLGIRLDSGDLVALSIQSRRLLDAAGFPGASIVASDRLDEYAIRDLKARGAKIDTWGIGTNLVTSKDQPALGGVYKMAALRQEDGSWATKVKLSETAVKTSYPGRLNVRRYAESDGTPSASVLYNELNGMPSASFTPAGGAPQALPATSNHDLLEPVFLKGEQVMEFPEIAATRDRAVRQWKRWSGLSVPSGPDHRLSSEKAALLQKYRR